MQSPRIAVVGSSNTDMVIKSRRIPRVGETVVGGHFVMAAGGKGANQAVAAARLGAQVTFVAKVGQDIFGDQAIAGYAREGIDTRFVFRDPEHATGVALILVDEQGDNLISVASGANHYLTPADVDQAGQAIRQAGVLVLQLETPLETVLHAARLAHAAGVRVILDPAPAPAEPLPRELLAAVTCVKPNETEAQCLTGIEVQDENSARQAAEELVRRGAANAIVTLGARGAVWLGGGQWGFVPGFRVKAQDSTAAGDAFSGALACALAREMPLAEATHYASLAAALSVTRMGAQPSLPTAEEVERFGQQLSAG